MAPRAAVAMGRPLPVRLRGVRHTRQRDSGFALSASPKSHKYSL